MVLISYCLNTMISLITLTYRIKTPYKCTTTFTNRQKHQLENDADAYASIICINGNFVERKTCIIPPRRPSKQRVIVRSFFMVSCATRIHIFTQKGINIVKLFPRLLSRFRI